MYDLSGHFPPKRDDTRKPGQRGDYDEREWSAQEHLRVNKRGLLLAILLITAASMLANLFDII